MRLKHQINKVKLKFIIIGILFLLFSNPLWCQEIKTTRDIGIWASVGVDYKLNKKWKMSFIQEIRSFDTAIRLQKIITEFGLDYRINKQFKLGAGLRYGYNRKRDFEFTNDIRYNIDFKFRSKLTNRLKLNYRFRFQHNYINLFTTYSDIEQKSKARNRIKFQYSLRTHTLYFATELFREYAIYKRPSFNKLRISMGDQLNTQLGNYKYGLAYERELNGEHSLNFFFLKLNYTFNLKRD